MLQLSHVIEKVNQFKQLIKDEELEIEVIKKRSVPQTKTDEDIDNPPDVNAKKTV